MKNKKELILQTAQNIFSHFGLKKTTIDDIAKQAGIGKGTIYNYFKSKEELFMSVVKREEEELKATIIDAINTTDNPEEQLILFFTTKVNRLFKLKNFYSIQANFMNVIYSEIENITKTYFKFEEKILTRILKEGIRQKKFKIEDVSLTVKVISMASKSLELYWLSNPEYKTPEKAIKEIKNLFNIFYNGIKY